MLPSISASSLLKRSLNRGLIRLHLPAVEIGAVVGKLDSDVSHADPAPLRLCLSHSTNVPQAAFPCVGFVAALCQPDAVSNVLPI